MAKEYSWAEVREVAARDFGGRWPDAELEEEIIERFREAPARVVDAIADVGKGFKAGRIQSPWPFLRKKLSEMSADVVVFDTGERDRVVRNTRQWMRVAGLYLDRESELEDELFGDVGRLRNWAGDQVLRAEMTALWRELRPLGEQLELEAAERIKCQYNALAVAKKRLLEKHGFRGFVAPDQVEEWSAS